MLNAKLHNTYSKSQEIVAGIFLYLLPPSYRTATNCSSDVRRWEACRNGGVSEGPWGFHRVIAVI